MEACEIVRLIVNKTIVPAEPEDAKTPATDALRQSEFSSTPDSKNYKTTHVYFGTSKNTHPKPEHSNYTAYPTEPP